MSVTTTRPAHSSSIRIAVLKPLYGAHFASFSAQADGIYRCGSSAACEFSLEFSGAESTHCTFIRKAGTFSVNRIDGRVWINDLPVRGVNRLTEGDVISLGPVSYRLEFLDAPSYPTEPDDRLSNPCRSAAIVALRPSDVTGESLPIPVVIAMPCAQDMSVRATLQKEMEEHQRLLTLRQQQLAELSQIVRERERDADSRLIAIEERSSQLTAQWNDLALRQERLATQERENSLRSMEADRQRQALTDQQRQLSEAAEQNSRTLAAVEEAQLEHSRQEAELSDRAKALADAEQKSALVASVNAETRSMELLAAIAAQKEAAVRECQQAHQAQIELRQHQQSLEARHLALQEWQSEIDSRANEVSARLLTLKSFRRQQRAAQTVAAEQAASQVAVDAENLRAAAIEAKREELDRREAEIVAAEERFAETRTSADAIVQAAESERTALLSANKDLLCERNFLSQLRLDLAGRETGIAEREVLVARQLDDMRNRSAVLDLRDAQLMDRVSEIDGRAAVVHQGIQQFQSDRHAHRETDRNAPPAAETNSDAVQNAAELLAAGQQLEEMQQALTVIEFERAATLAEREPLLSAVRELQKALQDARQDVEDAHRIKSDSWLQEQRLQQAYQSIEEHCHTLQLSESKLLQSAEQLESLRAELAESVRECDRLNAQLDVYSLPANDASPVLQTIAVSGFAESSETLSRELDQRAELLDRRDEELRERTRKILQTEGDVESQQRLLQDARQQLELARAEIQLAMRKYTEPAQDVASPLPGPQFGSSVAAEVISDRPLTRPTDPEVEPDDCESEAPSNFPATDLRSELAGLFGLRKPTTDTVTPPPLPLPSAAYVDESQPSGENQSVIFHFDSDAAQLAATESMRAVSGEELPPREENSDGYVRDYMEQLLSRNRKSAGIALPSELKAAKNKKDPAASLAAKTAGEPSPKSPPKVKSYIELYMAGNMGNLENSETLTISEPVVEVKGAAALNEERPVQPRQKMDLLKLKENMESFRTLSTLSVENALASHAIKVERHGFSGRAVFAALLIMITLLLGTANAYGTIDSPVLMWVTLAAAIAIFTELYRRYLAIAVHTRSPMDLLFTADHAKSPVQQSVKRTASGVAGPASRNDLSVDQHSSVPPATFVHPESPLAETLMS